MCPMVYIFPVEMCIPIELMMLSYFQGVQCMSQLWFEVGDGVPAALDLVLCREHNELTIVVTSCVNRHKSHVTKLSHCTCLQYPAPAVLSFWTWSPLSQVLSDCECGQNAQHVQGLTYRIATHHSHTCSRRDAVICCSTK